eukprot:10120479-Alexandrium_andersonii.AAC.1
MEDDCHELIAAHRYMRQLAAAARGAFPRPAPLQAPACIGSVLAPPSPNLFTDGGLALPTDHDLAHGGSGLWFPDAPAELLPEALSVFDFCHFE